MRNRKPFFTSIGTENRIGWTQWFSYWRYTKRVFSALDEMFPGGAHALRTTFDRTFEAMMAGFKSRNAPELAAIVIMARFFQVGMAAVSDPVLRLAQVQFAEWLSEGEIRTGVISTPIEKLLHCISAVERWYRLDLITESDRQYFYRETYSIFGIADVEDEGESGR